MPKHPTCTYTCGTKAKAKRLFNPARSDDHSGEEMQNKIYRLQPINGILNKFLYI